jgi:uncharacterized repeat protein (TIGR04138 family)
MPPPLPDDSPLPPTTSTPEPTLRQVAEAAGTYPVEALDFVQRGLLHTVVQIHGRKVVPGHSRHVSGQQLCLGLKDYALLRWGLMARTVLRRWGITATLDFGHIVFSLVEAGLLKTTEQDTLDDFRDVFDFSTLESGYRIGIKP